MPTPFEARKAASGRYRYSEVVPGSAVSQARGMFSKRLARTQDNSPSPSYREDSLRKVEGTRNRGEP